MQNGHKQVLVEVRGLKKTFKRKDGTVVEAVKGIDLDIYRGEVFSLLGPNGAGKSTTISMAAMAPVRGSRREMGDVWMVMAFLSGLWVDRTAASCAAVGTTHENAVWMQWMPKIFCRCQPGQDCRPGPRLPQCRVSGRVVVLTRTTAARCS